MNQNLDQPGWCTISSTMLFSGPQVGENVPFIHYLSGDSCWNEQCAQGLFGTGYFLIVLYQSVNY